MVSIKKVCRFSLDYVFYEHSKKLTPYLFQNMLSYISNFTGNEKIQPTIIFGALLS